jgi:thiaminase/transcriptional activator TenA
MPPRYGRDLGNTFLAKVLSQDQHEALQVKRTRLLNHPLWQGLKNHQTSLGHLRTFALQDAWLICDIHRLDGLAIAKAPDADSAAYLINKLTPKQGALTSLQAFGTAIGLEPAQLINPTPLAGCAALTTQFYYHLARSSFVEAIACLGASETIFVEICGRIEQPLQDNYGLSTDASAFFSLHEQLEAPEAQMNTLIDR